MGGLKKIVLLIVLGIISTTSIIFCCDKVIKEESGIILQVARDGKKDNSGYLALGEDPYADDAKLVEAALLDWNFVSNDGKKVAYLTFDDGPSTIVTEQVLDVLKKNEVKGTFFVLGSMIDKNQKTKDMLKRMVQEGHAIGNHSYTHNYKILYPSGVTDTYVFMEDMNKSLNSMQEVLGEDFYTRVMRFPGGHSAWDTEEVDEYLKRNNYAFVDWNTLTGDADVLGQRKEELVSNLKQTVSDIGIHNDKIVVLMHDTNSSEENGEVLQEVIDHLKELGYEFRTLK